jgi:hypothetical protein
MLFVGGRRDVALLGTVGRQWPNGDRQGRAVMTEIGAILANLIRQFITVRVPPNSGSLPRPTGSDLGFKISSPGETDQDGRPRHPLDSAGP